MMIGVLVQVFSLLSGLMINFFTPIIYGIEQYGLFIKLNILVYVFHRFSDITSESLIAMAGQGSVFFQSLVVNGVYFSIFLLLQFFFASGSALLLGSMLLSSSVLLSFYAQRRLGAVLALLIVVTLTFFSLGCLQWAGSIYLDIQQLMVVSTLPVAVVGLVVLSWHHRAELVCVSSYSALCRVVAALPKMMSMTLVFNSLTNFIPYFAAQVLAPREMGVLRIMLSVVQSVSSVFPLNIKHLFSTLVRSVNKQHLLYALMNVAAVYFMALACGFLVLGQFYAPVQIYTKLLALLPLFFCSMLIERYLQSGGQGRLLAFVNLLTSGPIFIGAIYSESLQSFYFLYAASIVVYFSILLTVARVRTCWHYLLLLASCVVQSILIEISVLAVFAVLLCTLVLFVARKSILRESLNTIKGEIR